MLDAAGFERQLASCRPALLRFALHRTRGNRDVAEDLLQQSILHAMRYWDALEDKERFANWMRRIIGQRHIEHVRRQRMYAEYDSDVELVPSELNLFDLDPAERAMLERLHYLLGTKDYSLLLAKAAGYTYSDIGRAIGKKPMATKSYIHRVLQRARELAGAA
jgi:RNA polymerase sigma factor (sigma-70 family)